MILITVSGLQGVTIVVAHESISQHAPSVSSTSCHVLCVLVHMASSLAGSVCFVKRDYLYLFFFFLEAKFVFCVLYIFFLFEYVSHNVTQ